MPTLHLITPCLALAALIYAPAAVATRPSALPTPETLAALAALGVVCTAVAFVAFMELIREAGPIRASVITYVNPAIAVAAGALFLDEALTATVLAAFLLILTGSVLANAGSGSPPAGGYHGRHGRRAGRAAAWSPLRGLPEERPGSTGQGGGQRPPGVTRGTVPQKTDRPALRRRVRVKRWCKRPPAPGVTQAAR